MWYREKQITFSISERRERERRVGENEAIHKTHIESGSDRQVPASIDEVSEEQCGEQKQRQDTFKSNVCSEKEQCHWNPRTVFSESNMHGPSPRQALRQTSGHRRTRSVPSGRKPDKTPVQMAPKCPVLPPYRLEDQAQVVPTRLAQVHLVLPSGFSTKSENSRRFIEGGAEIWE